MLELNLHDSLVPQLKTTLMQWRREHVSRWKVIATSMEVDNEPRNYHAVVNFTDSRFLQSKSRKDSLLGFIEIKFDSEHNRHVYNVSSRLIKNERYAPYNSLYHFKSTHDIRKVAKWLRTYIHTFSFHEIAIRSFGSFVGQQQDWIREPLNDLEYIMNRMSRREMQEEVLRLALSGVEFVAPTIQKMAQRGPKLVADAVERALFNREVKHIFIDEDGSVVVSAKKEAKNEKSSEFVVHSTYPSFEQCPEYIQQQVTMLRIGDDKEVEIIFIPMVGARVNDREYWVIEQE